MDTTTQELETVRRLATNEADIRNIKETILPQLSEIKQIIHENHRSILATLGEAARLDRDQAAAQAERLNKQWGEMLKEERAERQRDIKAQAEATDRAIAALKEASKEAEGRNAPVRSIVDRWGGGLVVLGIILGMAGVMAGFFYFIIKWVATGKP